MPYSIVFSDEAIIDITEASEYYNEISENLENRFLSELVSTVDLISENPLHNQIRYKNIRIAFTETFPYGVHFITETNNIYIFRILHTKRFYK